MLSALLSGLWSRVTGYAIAIATTLAILWAAYAKGQTDAAARNNRARLEEINKARKVEDEVTRLDNDGVRNGLDRWMRDKR